LVKGKQTDTDEARSAVVKLKSSSSVKSGGQKRKIAKFSVYGCSEEAQQRVTKEKPSGGGGAGTKGRPLHAVKEALLKQIKRINAC